MKRQTSILLALMVGAAGLIAVSAAFARTGHVAATVVTVTAGKPSSLKFTISPKTFKHGAVTFKFTNGDTSGIAHDFKWCTAPVKTAALTCKGKGTKTLGMGQSQTLTVVVPKAGTYEYLCTVAGHAAAGMKGTVKVT